MRAANSTARSTAPTVVRCCWSRMASWIGTREPRRAGRAACDPDPLRAAELAGVTPGGTVTYSRAELPVDWFVEIAGEQPVSAHRAAHATGTPSVAVVAYGAGVPPEHTVDRLIALADLARDTGLLRAVSPTPGDGDASRPRVLGGRGPDGDRTGAPPAARRDAGGPDWIRLGPAASQIAVAFGATDWQIPAGDRTDAEWLAGAVGYRAVPR